MQLYESIMAMSPEALEAFRSQLRRRYSSEDLLDELRECAARIGASPTMREFGDDPETSVHPQTIVDHFGSWNTAKRQAGLLPRRMATREELLAALRNLGRELGRIPCAKDLEQARGNVASKGVYVSTFGSVREALRQAGFDAPNREEKLDRTVEFGTQIVLRHGRLPSFREWERLRGDRDDIMTAWQIYRAFPAEGGAWSAFLFAVSCRAEERVAAAAQQG